MASVTVAPRAGADAPDWPRKYPPLLALGVAVLLVLAVLPNSLNLPQTNPTQTLEYAPVPPDENVDTPPQGNLAAVGLGSSSALQSGGAPGGSDGGPGTTLPPPATTPGEGVKGNPTDKRCVGNPPRQTFDPLSPPCVAVFSGDNFGSTYQGVTGEEIRLLIYIDGGINYSSGTDGGLDTVLPTDELYDLFVPAEQPPNPEGHEHFLVRGLRSWQKYFNERFQTYGRRAHFYVYLSGARNAEARRADAAQLHKTVQPFAVLADASEGAEDAFLREMARRGVLNFGSFALRPEAFFNEFPKLIWSYQPSIEQQAENYTNYICKKVVGHPPVLAAPDIQQQAGGQRKIGMVHTTDRNQQGYIRLAQIVREKVEACGGKVEMTATFPECCLAQDNGDTGTYGQTQMAEFKQANITTILWPGGINGNFGKSATAINYYPEWIIAGDQIMDANNPTRLSQNTGSFDGRGIVVTPEVYQPALDEQTCARAYREVDQEMSRPNLGYLCEYYKNLMQMFIGIQVAGPRLGPTSVDKGFHAIPSIPSTNVQTPSCFYLPGDYTCVKDAQAEIWDANGQPPGDNRPGCWRSIEGGRRYLATDWPEGNVDAQFPPGGRAALPCNGYNASVRFNLA
jgi:hypothetical protein